MSRFNRGDEITVTNPVQPTRHEGGETGVVVGTERVVVGGTSIDLVQIQENSDGRLACCYADELTKN